MDKIHPKLKQQQKRHNKNIIYHSFTLKVKGQNFKNVSTSKFLKL